MANNPNERPGSTSDQELEREGIESEPSRGDSDSVVNRSSDESGEQFDPSTRSGSPRATSRGEDVDPDSAESDVDRDDTIDEP